jgi:hypothetical protein
MLFSWGRRFQQSLRHNIRLLSTQSQRPTSSSSSFGGSRNGGDERVKDFEYFLRSITSGVVVVGSTLGFWYCSSLSSPGANNSLHSFSDYATQDQFQQNYENKSKFLFNGNFPFLSLLVEIFIILNLLLYMT